MERFEGEILKCLDGTSNFTEDMIAKQIRRYQQELDDAKAEYAALQNARLNEAAEIRKLRTYYDEFRGWAEEFDAAPLEIKRMILSQLIERVEVGRKYQVTIKLNMAIVCSSALYELLGGEIYLAVFRCTFVHFILHIHLISHFCVPRLKFLEPKWSQIYS